MLSILLFTLTWLCNGRQLTSLDGLEDNRVFADRRPVDASDVFSKLHSFANARKMDNLVNGRLPFLLALSSARPDNMRRSLGHFPIAQRVRFSRTVYPGLSDTFENDSASIAGTVPEDCIFPNNFSLSSSEIYKASERVQRVKNALKKKEIRNVLAKCQFALQLEGNATIIDFRSLAERLNKSIEILENDAVPDEEDLMTRLIQTRNQIQAKTNQSHNIGEGYSFPITDELRSNASSRNRTIPRLKLVREDGSLDWDEFVASSRDLRRFGTEVWERLNGRELKEGVELVTEEVQRLQDIVNTSKLALDNLLEKEEQLKQQLLREKAAGKPLLDKSLEHLRSLDERVQELRKLVTVSELNLVVERICLSLQKEIEEGELDDVDMKLKLLVAELNLVEREFMSVSRKFGTVDFEEVLKDKRPNLLSLVDDEELDLANSRVSDLKTRLGIDRKAMVKIDWGTTGKVLRQIGVKMKEGLTLLALGTQLLFADMLYSWQLFMKAVRGTTLEPREVITLRRTMLDVFTVVPCMIIMAIPLSPVGHVMVFSFIQRYFPSFFPSCYSEKRMKLQELYAGVLSNNVEDTLSTRQTRKAGRGLPARMTGFVRKIFRKGDTQKTQEPNGVMTFANKNQQMRFGDEALNSTFPIVANISEQVQSYTANSTRRSLVNALRATKVKLFNLGGNRARSQ